MKPPAKGGISPSKQAIIPIAVQQVFANSAGHHRVTTMNSAHVCAYYFSFSAYCGVYFHFVTQIGVTVCRSRDFWGHKQQYTIRTARSNMAGHRSLIVVFAAAFVLCANEHVCVGTDCESRCRSSSGRVRSE